MENTEHECPEQSEIAVLHVLGGRGGGKSHTLIKVALSMTC